MSAKKKLSHCVLLYSVSRVLACDVPQMKNFTALPEDGKVWCESPEHSNTLLTTGGPLKLFPSSLQSPRFFFPLEQLYFLVVTD